MVLRINILLDVIALLLTTMVYFSGRRYNNAHGQKLLNVLEFVLGITIIFDLGSWILSEYIVNSFVLVLDYIITSFLYVAQSANWFFVLLYTHTWVGYGRYEKRWYRLLMILPLVYLTVLMLANVFTGCIFTISFENGYQRGPLNIIFNLGALIYMVWICIIAILCTIQGKGKYNRSVGMRILMSVSLPIIGIAVQQMFFGISLALPFSGMGAVSMFLSVQMREIDRYQLELDKQKEELQNARISIMMSQIQPHFLYNSLTAIMRLCDTNPKEAKNAIADFADYLRHNLDSLKNNSMIPVKEELTHTDVYVKFEKMRFGDRLKYKTDINYDNFFVPPLTIQPLVENAIKHGICKKREGGTVKIATYETDNFYCVEVSDNGVGFDVNKPFDDKKTHVGMENVKERIKVMANGELIIESTPSVGTKAIIKIPREHEK